MFWSNGQLRLGRERCGWGQERGYSCQTHPQMATPLVDVFGTIFKTHGTRAGSLLLAKKFPFLGVLPTRQHCTLCNSAAEHKPCACLSQHPIFVMHHIPRCFQQLSVGLITGDDKVSAPSSPWRPPLAGKVPIWDATSPGTLVFYHMSGARNNSLEGAFPPPLL